MSTRDDVARAIHERSRPGISWDAEWPDVRDYWLGLADAAIAALGVHRLDDTLLALKAAREGIVTDLLAWPDVFLSVGQAVAIAKGERPTTTTEPTS